MKRAARAAEQARLAALKNAQYQAARSRLLGGDLAQASAHLAEGEMLERLSRLGGHRPAAPVFAMLVIGACGLLVFAAWKIKLSTFADLEVSIRADTTAARLTLARPAAFESVRGNAVEVGRLSLLAAQISDLPSSPAGKGWVRVEGAPVEIKALRAAQGVTLALALVAVPAKAPTLEVRAYGKGIDGELLVRPGALVSAGEADRPAIAGVRLAGDALDVVSFGCDGCQEAPLRFDLAEVEPFAFGNVPVSQLGFAVERVQSDGTTYFTSGLRAGSIRVLDADRVEAIQPGDSLQVEIGAARRFQIGRAAQQDTLSLVYEGTLKRLALGPLGAERDLSPSVLEFLYRQKALTLLWGAAVFLWGLFTAGRRLWQTKSD